MKILIESEFSGTLVQIAREAHGYREDYIRLRSDNHIEVTCPLNCLERMVDELQNVEEQCRRSNAALLDSYRPRIGKY